MGTTGCSRSTSGSTSSISAAAGITFASLLLLSSLNHAAGFTLPGAPLSSTSTARSRGSSLTRVHRQPSSRPSREPARGSLGHRRERAGHPSDKGTSTARPPHGSRVGPLSAAAGEKSGQTTSSSSERVVYAQDVLDRAWRSKRRIEAQGRGQPLGQRFLSAFGAISRPAMFVDDREFMDSTLDNVVRVRRARHRSRQHTCSIYFTA